MEDGTNLLIQAEKLARYYDGHCAVRDVSFELNRGEILGFLGPNGAGKSTTLRMVCGTIQPTSGRVLVGGCDVATDSRGAKRLLGYLPDKPPLYGNMTVDEYLAFCAAIHGIPKSLLDQHVSEVKERCAIERQGKRLIKTLSKGYQQRVGIAQAVVHKPPVVVLDEPTVGLDPLQIREIRALIRSLSDNHGVLFSSHILSEIQAVCSRVQVIHAGRLILSAEIGDLARNIEGSILLVRTRSQANSELLREIPGVERIQALENYCYRIVTDQNFDPREKIAEVLVSSGCGLLELQREEKSLERWFLDLVSQKPESPPSLPQ